MLRAFSVDVLVDIRTVPRSRHNPQYNADTLRTRLRGRRIRYVQLPELGGLRRARPDSPNTAWRNASFRGFADYMQTEDFEVGIAKLRALVADVLCARGAEVEHIMSLGRASAHRITPFAKVQGQQVTYPG
jgi:uncharacterized protein (DUF488 family)